MLSSMCQHVARLQFDSCVEKRVEQSWWPEFKVFGSMPWCSGVCSHGTSSFEGWRKKIVVKATVSLTFFFHEFTSLFSPKVIVAGLPRKAFQRKQAFVDISVFLWLRKQQPRFAQRQPKCHYQMKELDRTTIYRYCRGEWEMGSSCRGDSLLPFGTWWDMEGDPR